jgi:hypothetical protein
MKGDVIFLNDVRNENVKIKAKNIYKNLRHRHKVYVRIKVHSISLITSTVNYRCPTHDTYINTINTIYALIVLVNPKLGDLKPDTYLIIQLHNITHTTRSCYMLNRDVGNTYIRILYLRNV